MLNERKSGAGPERDRRSGVVHEEAGFLRACAVEMTV